MTWLLGFVFENTWGKFTAAAVGLAGLVVAFAWDQRNIGAQRATQKIENATSNAVSLGRRAADRSGAGGVRQRRIDPSTRDD